MLGHGLGALVLIALAHRVSDHHPGHAERPALLVGPRQLGTGRLAGASPSAQRRVEAAAAEAAEDDAAFAPDAVKANAAALFKQIQAAWDRGDRARLATLVGPDLLTEWERRLDDLDRRGWRNRVQIIGEPTVEYVGLNHRGDAQADTRHGPDRGQAPRLRRGPVRQPHQARRPPVARPSALREFWTLGATTRRPLDARLDRAGRRGHARDRRRDHRHHVVGRDQAMRDEALIEGAVADAVPDGHQHRRGRRPRLPGRRARRRARPEPRRRPVRARRARGDRAPGGHRVGRGGRRRRCAACGRSRTARRSESCSTRATRARRTRLVVRGPKVKQIRIVGLDAGAPPADDVGRGRDRGPALHRGSRHHRGARREPVARRRSSPSAGRSRSTATRASRG